MHNETVGITKIYSAIASCPNCRAKIMRLRILNNFVIAELAERMIKEFISFLLNGGLKMESINDFKFNKRDLNFLIKLKARDFKQQNIHNISEQQIKDYLFERKWKQRDAVPMCEIIDDIMNLDFSEIFDYLSLQVVKEASRLSINDFSDFISK